MEEWMQQGQGLPSARTRSYSMSHADNLSSFYHQLQHKSQPAPALGGLPMTDSFRQEGSPLSMSSSCGSDDAPYSSDTVVSDYSHQKPMQLQTNPYEQPQAQQFLSQRRASLSSTPVGGAAGASLGFLGGFVGEGLRAEYASRRPGGRRKSISVSSPQQQFVDSAPEVQAAPTESFDSSASIEAMRRNSLPSVSARRNSLSCPLVHNYTPLTAVPTLGRALAEGNLGQRKSIQSFLSMLAQSANERSDKRRKRKASRKDRGKRYKRSDYDESSDEDEEDDDSAEEGLTGSHPMNHFASPTGHDSAGTSSFSGFDYASGALAPESGSGNDSSSDTIPSSMGEQSTPGPFDPITPSSSSEPLFQPGGYAASGGADPASVPAYSASRPRSRSSPPSYIDSVSSSAAPLSHQQQLQRQYHIAQTNKRLQELRQQHLERLQRQMELERQQTQQQRHSYEYTPSGQHYASAQPQAHHLPQYPHQGLYQSHVLDLEVPHHAAIAMGGAPSSASLPAVLPSHETVGPYHHHAYPPEPLAEFAHTTTAAGPAAGVLEQDLMEHQMRGGQLADFDFYNEFSDFNMCEPGSMESLCRTVPEQAGLVHQPAQHVGGSAAVTAIPVGSDQLSTDDGPVSEILDEFSVVPSSAFIHNSWLSAQDGTPVVDGAYPLPIGERKDQQLNEDVFNDLFNLEDPGMGSSH